MTIQLVLTLVGLTATAVAFVVALRYAKKLGRAEVEKENADAIREAKKRADGVRHVTRTNVIDRLRRGDY